MQRNILKVLSLPKEYHPSLPIAPSGTPTHIESDVKLECKRPISNDSRLVHESVINSLIEREVQLTSHKAARMTARFTMSGKVDFWKSAFGSRMFVKCIVGIGRMSKKMLCVKRNVGG